MKPDEKPARPYVVIFEPLGHSRIVLDWKWMVLVCAEMLALSSCGARGERSMPPAMAESSRYRDPLSIAAPVEKYTLANGLVVVLNEDRRLPFVLVDVTYHVGAADDPAGRAGMAHLVEHLFFHGSRHVPEGKHFEYLETAGAGTVEGMTSYHATSLWELVPRSELALALWLESDRMAFALDATTQPMIERERRVLELERAERVANVPNGYINELTAEQIFPTGHPYRRSGELSALRQVTLQELREFQRKYYTPNNAVLLLSGDFDGSEAKKQVAGYFERIPGRPSPVWAKPTPIVLGGSRAVRIEARVDDARVLISWPSPPFGAPGDAELDVVANHLNRHDFDTIVRKNELALALVANQYSARLGSIFRIEATLRPNVQPAAMIAAIDAALNRVRSPGLDADAVRGGTRHWEYGIYLRQEDIVARALALAEHTLIDGEVKYFETQMHRYREVTVRSTAQAVSAYLLPDRRVVTVVEPNMQAPVAGKLVVELP